MAILLGPRLHQPVDLHLRQSLWYLLQLTTTQLSGNLVEQHIDAINTDDPQHFANIVFCMRNKWHI